MEGFIHPNVHASTQQGDTPEIGNILPEVFFQVGACRLKCKAV